MKDVRLIKNKQMNGGMRDIDLSTVFDSQKRLFKKLWFVKFLQK